MLRGAVRVGYGARPAVEVGGALFDVKAAVSVAGDVRNIWPCGGASTQHGNG